MAKKKKKHYKKLVGPPFASDVDDTLVLWSTPTNYNGPLVEFYCNGYKETAIPNIPAIEHLKKMRKRGHTVIVWSRGGEDWAEAVVEALGIGEYVDVVCDKLHYHMDDVRDPKDKLGRWCYVDINGNNYREDFNGEIKKHESNKDIDKGDF